MSSTLLKKLFAAFFFLLAVVFLIGDDDDPGLIAETAQTGDTSSGGGGATPDYDPEPEPLVSPERQSDYYDDDEDLSFETDSMSDEELIDDTQGFEPLPMDDTTPVDGMPSIPEESQ